jgi:hypothetical protein
VFADVAGVGDTNSRPRESATRTGAPCHSSAVESMPPRDAVPFRYQGRIFIQSVLDW